MSCPIAYHVSGQTDPDAPTILLSSGLGGVSSFWAPQLAILEPLYRVVVYDQLGTGKSQAQLKDDYRLEDMARELLWLLDHLAIKQCHFMGHALGGIIGLTLATLAPQRLASLVVINGWAELDPHTKRCFEVRSTLLEVSDEAYIHAQPCFLFPADWLSQHAEEVQQEEYLQRQHFQGKHNLLRRLNALMNVDLRQQLSQITLPCLLLCAKDDLLVPWFRSQQLAEHLPNSDYYAFDYGAHAMSVSDPDPFNQQLILWLSKVTGSP